GKFAGLRMMTEQQQEQASLYVTGALPPDEREVFEAELRSNSELRELTRALQHTAGLLVFTGPAVRPPAALRGKVLADIDSRIAGRSAREKAKPVLSKGLPGFLFHGANDPKGWKELPVRGAWLKFLSIDRDRGYAVLLGKLEPGVRYPAHH